MPLLYTKKIPCLSKKALSSYQKECIERVSKTVQIEQEAYLDQHPEVIAMLELFMSKMVHQGNRKGALAAATKHFTRSTEELDDEIRKHLNISPSEPYTKKDVNGPFDFVDYDLEMDLRKIRSKYYPEPPITYVSSPPSTIVTMSSSFISFETSDTTLPTPEPVRTPEPTLSETMFVVVSTTVDKAIYLHVDEQSLRYDTAYVELIKAVEEAMEIPVTEIKEDIVELYMNAYEAFEADILEKERIAAERAWERRMRKKMKRTLRRLSNFKGYESPPDGSEESTTSESESDEVFQVKIPPRPCICHPQYEYNRYPKDRFGIYLPNTEQYPNENITVTPVYSTQSVEQTEDNATTQPDTSTKK